MFEILLIEVPTTDTIWDKMEEMNMSKEDLDAMMDSMGDTFLPVAHKNECTFYELFRDHPVVPIPRTFYSRAMGKKGEAQVPIESGTRFLDQATGVIGTK